MGTLSDDDKLTIAARFAAANNSGDPAASAALFAPGALTWHNFDEVEVTREQSERTVAWLRRTVADLNWTEVATLPTPNGFVAQQVMPGTAPGGPLRVQSCVVVTLDDDGLITRIDEYLDTAQTTVLRD
jgi:SnoaL-like domain